MKKTQVEEEFSEYFSKWMHQLEEYHLQLLAIAPSSSSSSRSAFADQHFDVENDLVKKLTSHHKDYYTAKWAAAKKDVLAFFTPIWFTPLENAYSWFTGWKPSMAFRVIDSMRKNKGLAPDAAVLTEEQLKMIGNLRMRMKLEEEKVEREMERLQVSVADRKMVELVRLGNRVRNGGDSVATPQMDGMVEAAMRGMLAGLEKVMKMGDCVRLKTMKGLLDLLSPSQSVEFLCALTTLQIQLRKWGKKREDNLRKESEVFVRI